MGLVGFFLWKIERIWIGGHIERVEIDLEEGMDREREEN